MTVELHLPVNHNSNVTTLLQKLHDLLPLTRQLRPARGCLGILLFDLTTKTLHPSTVAPHDFLSRISIYGRAPNGYWALRSCTRISLVSGKALAATTTGTRGGSSVTWATNDVACGNCNWSSRGNADSQDDHTRGYGLAESRRRPARGRKVDRTGWILLGSIVLDRFSSEHRGGALN